MKKSFENILSLLLTVSFVVIGATYVYSTGLLKRNIGDLIKLSDLILVGKVVSVTDGLDGNLPYTEITIEVSNAIKSNVSGIYTFRQFGLLKPKDMGNGLINANVSPDGWPKFREDEEVMVFLYKAASLTGLRTTVGLFQGKFTIEGGTIKNAINNLGLFQDVSVAPRRLTNKEQSMLQRKKGPINAETFITFVTKAVNENWFK